MTVVEKEEDFTPETLQKFENKYKPSRVIIEFNPFWGVAKLEEMEFAVSHGVWTKNCGEFTLYVEGGSRPAGAGSLWEGQVRAFYNRPNASLADQDGELFALPCARYREVRS